MCVRFEYKGLNDFLGGMVVRERKGLLTAWYRVPKTVQWGHEGKHRAKAKGTVGATARTSQYPRSVEQTVFPLALPSPSSMPCISLTSADTPPTVGCGSVHVDWSGHADATATGTEPPAAMGGVRPPAGFGEVLIVGSRRGVHREGPPGTAQIRL